MTQKNIKSNHYIHDIYCQFDKPTLSIFCQSLNRKWYHTKGFFSASEDHWFDIMLGSEININTTRQFIKEKRYKASTKFSSSKLLFSTSSLRPTNIFKPGDVKMFPKLKLLIIMLNHFLIISVDGLNKHLVEKKFRKLMYFQYITLFKKGLNGTRGVTTIYFIQ